jgi:hypothetical protein
MFTPPEEVYQEEGNSTLVAFDLRVSGAGRSFSRERAAWGKRADVEMLDSDHPVLVVKPGGALELMQ